MCFHSVEEMEQYQRRLARKRRNDGDMTWLKSLSDRKRLIGAMPTVWDDARVIAIVAKDLIHWHPGTKLDFRDVNNARSRERKPLLGMYFLPEVNWRPVPNVAIPEMDDERGMAEANTIVQWYLLRARDRAYA